MYKNLRPNLIYETVYDIDFDLLYGDGIRHLFFDVDNTLITYGQDGVSLQCINLFNSMRSIGFESITLVSNSSNFERIQKVAQQLNLPGIYFACKPFVFTMRRVMNDANIAPDTVAFVGDQLFTDIVMANLLNLKSVFVEPLDATNVSFLRSFQYKVQQAILNQF
ncbi:MAG: YqeG family HAD IIIA-type phosphatase [Candidatus Margulisiibacteriota bacterium]